MRKINLKVLLAVAAVLLLAGAVHATAFYLVTDPPYDPNSVPFTYDPNLVQGRLLGSVTHRAGIEGSIAARYFDPDNDPVTISLSNVPPTMLMHQDPNTLSYTITWKPTTPGVYGVVVNATDQPGSGTALTDKGTILWKVNPDNQAPFLGPVGNQSIPATH